MEQKDQLLHITLMDGMVRGLPPHRHPYRGRGQRPSI